MSWRVSVIQKITKYIDLLTFYPKLQSFYEENLNTVSPLILDVGSNRGQTLDFFNRIRKDSRIIGFEPNKDLYKKLLRNYGSNKNFTFYNIGVSNKNGSLIFNENIMHETSTFENLNYDSKYLQRKARILGITPEEIVVQSYEVKVVDLNSFIAEHNLKDIDVIKIDVEGHEYQCLEGLFENGSVTNQPRFIQLENHFDDMYHESISHIKIDELLRKNNYNPVFRLKNKIGDYEEVIYKLLG